MVSKIKYLLAFFCLLGAFFVYLYLEVTPSLAVPDLTDSTFDEAYAAWGTLRIMNNLPDNPVNLKIGNRHFILNNDDKHGALEAYILYPFVYFAGLTTESVRLPAVLFGAATILLLFGLGWRLFNFYVGILAGILLSTNISFLSFIKNSTWFGFSLPFFALLALFILHVYYKTRAPVYYIVGMLILGIGYNVKGYFIWFIGAVFLLASIRYFRPKRIGGWVILVGMFSVLLGAAPTLYFQIRTGLFVRIMEYKWFHTTSFGIDNFAFFHNISLRFSQLLGIVSGLMLHEGGKAFSTFKWVWPNNVPVVVFFACFGYLLFILLRGKTFFSKKALSFLLLVTIATGVNSAITFTAFWQGHLYILVPFLQLIVAVALWELVGAHRHILVRVTGVVFFASLLIFNCYKCVLFSKAMKDGYAEVKHCNIKIVTDWLIENKRTSVVFLDPYSWAGAGYFSNLQLGPGNTLIWADQDMEKRIRDVVSNATAETTFVIKNPNNPDSELPYVLVAVARAQKKLVPLKCFTYRDGGEKFLIFSME